MSRLRTSPGLRTWEWRYVPGRILFKADEGSEQGRCLKGIPGLTCQDVAPPLGFRKSRCGEVVLQRPNQVGIGVVRLE